MRAIYLPTLAVYCCGFTLLLSLAGLIGPELAVGIMVGSSGVGVLAALVCGLRRTFFGPRRLGL